ncbi:YggS family pyridoxal phosphate-dependent enzyme [Pararhodobacter zhoushanensis]|uniref:YggS family pyridoxal phosphate-dependent enzyme n=1 Tax=Pararhodobacter zhoushanensis TaxID=2479545 RepID=UPI000F8DBB8E|nr:YggS family pyridoxal phosphate-dependent enzyme [Pararhodobacter zhoushanensis]
MTLDAITSRLRDAETRAGRAEGSVTLIAVSKVQPAERIESVLAQGQRVFGENRVQEAQGRWPAFQERFEGISLHLIGPLQTNKARAAVSMFDAIHSVDRLKLAETIARLADEEGRCPELFVQVNTGAEPQKAGVLPDELERLIASVRALSLPLKGLMCIPPADQDAAVHFRLLAALAAQNGLEGLSMGMSDDFEVAVELGATHVRVGSAIFGERVPPKG